jgi:hypothetical protein
MTLAVRGSRRELFSRPGQPYATAAGAWVEHGGTGGIGDRGDALEEGVVHPAGFLACLFGELVEGAVRQADPAAWLDTRFVSQLGKELGERQLAVLTGGPGAVTAGGRQEAFLVALSRGLEEDPRTRGFQRHSPPLTFADFRDLPPAGGRVPPASADRMLTNRS